MAKKHDSRGEMGYIPIALLEQVAESELPTGRRSQRPCGIGVLNNITQKVDKLDADITLTGIQLSANPGDMLRMQNQKLQDNWLQQSSAYDTDERAPHTEGPEQPLQGTKHGRCSRPYDMFRRLPIRHGACMKPAYEYPVVIYHSYHYFFC